MAACFLIDLVQSLIWHGARWKMQWSKGFGEKAIYFLFCCWGRNVTYVVTVSLLMKFNNSYHLVCVIILQALCYTHTHILMQSSKPLNDISILLSGGLQNYLRVKGGKSGCGTHSLWIQLTILRTIPPSCEFLSFPSWNATKYMYGMSPYGIFFLPLDSAFWWDVLVAGLGLGWWMGMNALHADVRKKKVSEIQGQNNTEI